MNCDKNKWLNEAVTPFLFLYYPQQIITLSNCLVNKLWMNSIICIFDGLEMIKMALHEKKIIVPSWNAIIRYKHIL